MVVDADSGELLAHNVVDSAGDSADEARSVVTELVESSPFPIERVGVTVRDPAHQAELASALTPDKQAPDWYAKVVFSESPVAYAFLAKSVLGSRGVAIVADLAADGAPYPDLSVAAVDTAAPSPVCAASTPTDAHRVPVTDPAGADSLADGIALMPVGDQAATTLLACGVGADLPGVTPALEAALDMPVQVADDAAFGAATGAALAAAAAPAPARGMAGRWLVAGSVAAAAVLLSAGVASAMLLTGNDNKTQNVAETQTIATTSSAAPAPTSTVTHIKRPTPRRTITPVQTPIETPTTTEIVPTTTETPPVVTSSVEPTPTETETETSTVARRPDRDVTVPSRGVSGPSMTYTYTPPTTKAPQPDTDTDDGSGEGDSDGSDTGSTPSQ